MADPFAPSTDPDIPTPTRADLLPHVHGSVRDMLAANKLDAAQAANEWAGARRIWDERHKEAAIRRREQIQPKPPSQNPMDGLIRGLEAEKGKPQSQSSELRSEQIDTSKLSPEAIEWLKGQADSGRIFRNMEEFEKEFRESQRPRYPIPFANPSEQWLRHDRINRAIQSGGRPDPEDLAEEAAEEERYRRSVDEAFERKRKELESEAISQKAKPRTPSDPKPASPKSEPSPPRPSAMEVWAEPFTDAFTNAITETKPPPSSILGWIDSPRLRQLEAWLWKRPKVAWLFFLFIMSFIWFPQWGSAVWSWFSSDPPIPTIARKLSLGFNWPQWSASWITVPLGVLMFVILFLLLVRGRQVSEERRSRANLNPERLLELRNEGGAILEKLRRHHVLEPYKTLAEAWAKTVEDYLSATNAKVEALQFNNPAIDVHIPIGVNDTTSQTRDLFRWLRIRLIRLDNLIKKIINTA